MTITHTTQAAAIIRKLKADKVKNRYAAKAKVRKIQQAEALNNWLAR